MLTNGKPVKSAKQWWKKRRPEIVEHYDREIYGRMAAHLPVVSWSVKESRERHGWRKAGAVTASSSGTSTMPPIRSSTSTSRLS